VMAGANHTGSSTNEPASYAPGAIGVIPSSTHLLYVQPGYTTYDASLGVAKDNWTAQVYGSNLTNSNASTFTSSEQWITTETPLRPRVLGVKFGYKF
jgi:iron complex outermembrane recepter protein